MDKAKTLVVIFDSCFFNDNLSLLENKKVVSCFSHNCMTIKKSNVAIAISSFYEKSGTYINCDGVKQKVISKMNKENPMESVSLQLLKR
ncbi:MAG: hypothetical protein ACNI3H_11915 [Halarcobacter ebronensis]